MNKMRLGLAAGVAVALIQACCAAARPVPNPVLLERLQKGPEIIGIVHWGLNTFTDQEWGFGDSNTALLVPAKFDADQIVGAAKAGGLGGLVIVCKHHDGFCLWPTKTTDYNISASPFRCRSGGVDCRDYVKAMSEACRRAGIKFGVYVSPWDRHDPDYAKPAYVAKYHAQIKELLGGAYGEVFEMWFDGANGGNGWYGGTRERRRIGSADDYYQFSNVFRFVRALQPKVTIFAGENDASDFRWPGNEAGILSHDSRATIETVGGFANGRYGNPNYGRQINVGSPTGTFFRACEADFPLRRGWFWHARDNGKAKNAAYLAKLYLSSVGNGGTMNIGLSPNRDGLLGDDDCRTLKGFDVVRRALFAREVKPGETFNIVVLSENLSRGEQVDAWEFAADGNVILRGTAIGRKRIRVLETPCSAKSCALKIVKSAGDATDATFKLYRADPELVKLVLASSSDHGETDTAKWMTVGR
jgi:alpha-L-fucosidase